jgi:quinol-cytochrome oxidoreductase complex cytochrome b subunit
LGSSSRLAHEAAHRTPSNSASWMYVFGSAATVLLMLQVVTGILLALVYSPSANEAWGSLQFLNHNIALGWYLRALHGWGSNFMIAIVLIHMVQVFLFGAYKFPRELTWMVGVVLLLLTLGMAFTGQVMRFDGDAYWGLGIGASIASRVPIIGAPLVHLVLGGPIIGAATLSRFFTLHVFVIPGLLLAGAGVHIWMTLLHGVSDWPMPGRIVTKSTYEREYQELTAKTGIPFVPDAAWKDAVFAAAILFAVMACAFFFRPIWTQRAAGPNHHSNSAQARHALSVDLRGACLSAALHRDPDHAHRSRAGNRGHAAASAGGRRGRAALGAPSRRSADGRGHRGFAGHLHAARNSNAMESRDDGMDKRFGPAKIPAQSFTARAARRAGAAG